MANARRDALHEIAMSDLDLQLLRLDEVAAICRTTINTVRYWIATKKLPSLRPGRRRLVRRVDLDRFLEGEREQTP